DVALLARADRRRLADALVLDREGLDLGLAALPLAGEVVPDLAVGLARHRASDDGPFLVDGRDLTLVVVVPERLPRGDEAGAHPVSRGAQRQRGPQPAP